MLKDDEGHDVAPFTGEEVAAIRKSAKYREARGIVFMQGRKALITLSVLIVTLSALYGTLASAVKYLASH